MHDDDTPDTPHVLWACVEEGFHVGSRGGDFLGYVDRQSDGSYRAYDARSQEIGDFAVLSEATAAVSAGASGDGEPSGDLQGTVR